jgi:peptidoglycan/xylan/chitin deacetylase (PgdA/CDA1 family)
MSRFDGERLIRVLDGAGVNRALTSLAGRPGLLTLAYHRIGVSEGQPFDDGLYSATAAGFRAQLLYLRERFDMLSVDALLEASGHGRLALTRPSALITFDDGYRDNCEVAMPILRELGIPAVFFVAASYIDEPRLTWWDRVAYIVKRTTRAVLELDYPRRLVLDLPAVGRNEVARQILRAYKQTPSIDHPRFFEHLHERAEVTADVAALGRDLFMSWDQVRELKDAGMEIGGHTYTHPVLSRIPEKAQRDELSRAKERLEAESGGRVRMMAYPVGGRDAFDGVTKRLAREAGYRMAFSYYGGYNRPDYSDMFDLRRMPVDRDDTLPAFRFRAAANNLVGRAIL